MIEHLLSTNADQTRKYEALKAAMDRNNVASDAHNDYAPAKPLDLDATIIPTEVPDTSKTKDLSETPEVNSASATLDGYCTLIQGLLTEVEAKVYSSIDDMRCRIREDVIHTHKRETRLLRAVHGHVELKEKMREKSWSLADMAEEEVEEGEQSQKEQRVQSWSGTALDAFWDSDPRNLDLKASDSFHDDITREHVGEVEQLPENGRTTIGEQARAPSYLQPILIFLGDRQAPWSPYNLTRTEKNSWVRSWVSGASRLGLDGNLSSNPLRSYTQNNHMPQLPFLRSGTSMLVTEGSRVVNTLASSEDLAALTDSADTDNHVSAQSEIDERALDFQRLCLAEGEKEGPQVELYSEPAAKDRERLGLADSTAWINLS